MTNSEIFKCFCFGNCLNKALLRTTKYKAYQGGGTYSGSRGSGRCGFYPVRDGGDTPPSAVWNHHRRQTSLDFCWTEYFKWDWTLVFTCKWGNTYLISFHITIIYIDSKNIFRSDRRDFNVQLNWSEVSLISLFQCFKRETLCISDIIF